MSPVVVRGRVSGAPGGAPTATSPASAGRLSKTASNQPGLLQQQVEQPQQLGIVSEIIPDLLWVTDTFTAQNEQVVTQEFQFTHIVNATSSMRNFVAGGSTLTKTFPNVKYLDAPIETEDAAESSSQAPHENTPTQEAFNRTFDWIVTACHRRTQMINNQAGRAVTDSTAKNATAQDEGLVQDSKHVYGDVRVLICSDESGGPQFSNSEASGLLATAFLIKFDSIEYGTAPFAAYQFVQSCRKPFQLETVGLMKELLHWTETVREQEVSATQRGDQLEKWNAEKQKLQQLIANPPAPRKQLPVAEGETVGGRRNSRASVVQSREAPVPGACSPCSESCVIL
ncbi:unnamed protein product [Amoebophrya sp. A120]|nr:unnamed protein product [Amoebophrya sp. A120]|eukprot:GSA120T00020386001.1